jgi:hypothetical protein
VEDTELIDLLNRKVTQAIWDVQHPDCLTYPHAPSLVSLWTEVALCEQCLAEVLSESELEGQIARRGVTSALHEAAMLRLEELRQTSQ